MYIILIVDLNWNHLKFHWGLCFNFNVPSSAILFYSRYNRNILTWRRLWLNIFGFLWLFPFLLILYWFYYYFTRCKVNVLLGIISQEKTRKLLQWIIIQYSRSSMLQWMKVLFILLRMYPTTEEAKYRNWKP